MDFRRATIKSVFYDYPIENAVRAIGDTLKLKADEYANILPDMVRWREKSFTTTEATLMLMMLEDACKNVDGDKRKNVQVHSYVYCPFILVKSVADELLVSDKKNCATPVVRFPYLLRWKDVTSFVGEDLLSVAYKAAHDVGKYGAGDEPFLAWPDILPHDNRGLNLILNKGLSDVHAHFNASADIFHFNWLGLMNNIRNRRNVERIRKYQEVHFQSVGTELNYSLMCICVAAAYLRVKFYQKCVLHRDVTLREIDMVRRILEDELFADSIQSDLQAEIEVLKMSALKTSNGQAIDYAIADKGSNCDQRDNVFVVYQGERNLMYRFLLAYYGNKEEAWMLAPYFYLYILLKTRLRHEIVQSNSLIGFENFETYQDRKGIFINEDDAIGRNFAKYVVQTTLRQGLNDRMEARVTPQSLDVRYNDFSTGVFSGDKSCDVSYENLSFVVHFIKPNYIRRELQQERIENNKENVARYARYRQQLRCQMNEVLDAYGRDKHWEKWNNKSLAPKITGIDAASTEMFCRPEVFGHIFRYAAHQGLVHRTYHVGEDFLDIVDGLRAIDEAIMFLRLDGNCRVGHALALGVDAEKYYKERNKRTLMPKQYLLDNCVWLCMRAAEADIDIPSSLETHLVKLSRKLFGEIGYSGNFDRYHYWNSMLLRGDDPEYVDKKKDSSLLTDWDRTAKTYTNKAHHREIEDARLDETANKWYMEYHFSKRVKTIGDMLCADSYPTEIIEVVKHLQVWVLSKLSHLNIAVECNPTSNLRIGPFERYDEHPLLTTFDPLEHQYEADYPMVNASINTDDRGVFATSIYQEFSLMALALHKQIKLEGDNIGVDRYNPQLIERYIDRIRENGFKQRFK